MMRKCFSVRRSPIVIVISKLLKRHSKAKRMAPTYLRALKIDENNDIVSKGWIVYCHGISAKLTFVAVFIAAEDLAIQVWGLFRFLNTR